MVSSSNQIQEYTDGKYCFAIDRGGTFTDVMCLCPDGNVRTMKLLSEDPARYDDAPREGIRRILKNVGSTNLVNFLSVISIYICVCCVFTCIY